MNNNAANQTVRKAYFASGCFWGTEYWFMKAKGVIQTTAGFMGGKLEKPSYEEVKTGTTEHLECVEVVYDSQKTDFENLVKLFFETHNFTQRDGQGPDVGSQYLSCIFYNSGKEEDVAEEYVQRLTDMGYDVATQLREASTFWPAEDYHQQYYGQNGKEPYCHTYKKIF